MKMNTTIGALALGLGIAVTAQAQDVYITGSTAFRGQIFSALTDLGLTAQNSSSGGNNSFTCSGTITPIAGLLPTITANEPALIGNSVNAYCTFSGSAEGVSALITPGAASYIDNNATGTGTFSHTGVDLAFSDVWQAVTGFPTPPLEELQSATDGNNLPYAGIAVQPFAVVENSVANADGINNIKSFDWEVLYGNGNIGINFLTGTNLQTEVIAVGRYPLSGTRITMVLDDNPYTASPQQTLKQWALTSTGGSLPANCPGLASTDGSSPTGTAWVALPLGDGGFANGDGYFSGGNVGKAIHYSSTHSLTVNYPALAYISWSDAAKLTGGTGQTSGGNEGPISWDGQNPWTGGVYPALNGTNAWNTTALVNGGYELWGYEHLYVNNNDVGTWYETTFGPGLIDAIQYELVRTSPRIAVLESEMKVYRIQDGGTLSHF